MTLSGITIRLSRNMLGLGKLHIFHLHG
jgi:hypothetical protein